MDVTRRRFLLTGGVVVAVTLPMLSACAKSATASAAPASAFTGTAATGTAATGAAAPPGGFEVTRTDDDWKRRLTADQYDVLREAGTEAPYSSPLNDEHRRGVFSCAGCALDLYSSDTKFDSGTGWPSFWKPMDKAVIERTDSSIGMSRTEVLCRRCGGHLGHVFDDGPRPTGLRYCMNGVAMTFRPA